jgi:hypothetical protein
MEWVTPTSGAYAMFDTTVKRADTAPQLKTASFCTVCVWAASFFTAEFEPERVN